jgi:DnaJ-class molecular chaperone
MIYFKDCTTIEEVKAHYKKLAKQYHPDMGGDTATMQAINREYYPQVLIMRSNFSQ